MKNLKKRKTVMNCAHGQTCVDGENPIIFLRDAFGGSQMEHMRCRYREHWPIIITTSISNLWTRRPCAHASLQLFQEITWKPFAASVRQFREFKTELEKKACVFNRLFPFFFLSFFAFVQLTQQTRTSFWLLLHKPQSCGKSVRSF